MSFAVFAGSDSRQDDEAEHVNAGDDEAESQYLAVLGTHIRFLCGDDVQDSTRARRELQPPAMMTVLHTHGGVE